MSDNINILVKNEEKNTLIKDKLELYNSLYAQFYHGMVSRIEAITVKVFYNINSKIKKFTRDQLYDNVNMKKILKIISNILRLIK